MPVWHESTKDIHADGRIAVVGIIEEQHPDRARLFMQWKQMDWPLLVDSLDLLDFQAVPSHFLIDEAGIVRDVVRARGADDMRQIVEEFINQPAVEIGVLPTTTEAPNIDVLAKQAREGDADDAVRLADAVTMWPTTGEMNLDDAIEAYELALKARPDDGELHFHTGVAYRKRFDSNLRQPGDFAKAIDHWSSALRVDPNQYIWRRRIQQYGPRLDKPYSFYDWVHEAREEISARGETPVPLAVEPGGAEFAYPARQFESAADATEPDAEARIARDDRGYINVEIIRVANTGRRNTNNARMHVLMTPNESVHAHWNNEAEPLSIWINPPDSWQVNAQRITYDNPADAATSNETRRLEFEINPPEDVEPGTYTIEAYALYNVCEGAQGTCLYRRLDIPIEIATGQR